VDKAQYIVSKQEARVGNILLAMVKYTLYNSSYNVYYVK